MLTADSVGTTRARRNPALPSSSRYPAAPSRPRHGKHDDVEHLARVRRVTRRQCDLDDWQSAAGLHRTATVAEDGQPLVFSPIVDAVGE